MFALLGWIVVGLLAGLLARALVPGPQPMGALKTIMLGLLGSIVGGAISCVVHGEPLAQQTFHVSGLLMSTVGAFILLLGYVKFARRYP